MLFSEGEDRFVSRYRHIRATQRGIIIREYMFFFVNILNIRVPHRIASLLLMFSIQIKPFQPSSIH
jgi:hypothetical protein